MFGLAWFVLTSCGKIGIDKRDQHGMTSLMRAAQRGDVAEVERLIARGADVNATVPTRDLRVIPRCSTSSVWQALVSRHVSSLTTH
jgi:hypothetical protein